MRVRLPKWRIFKPLHFLIETFKKVYGLADNRIKKNLRLQLIVFFGISLIVSMIAFGIFNSLLVKEYAAIDYNNGISNIDNEARFIVEALVGGAYIQYAEEYLQEEAQGQKPQQEPQQTPQQPSQQTPQQPSQQAPPGGATSQGLNPSTSPTSPPDALGEGSVQEQVYTADNQTKEQLEYKLRAFIEGRAKRENVKILITDLDGTVIQSSSNATETKIDIHSVIRNAMNTRNERDYENSAEFVSFYPVNIGDLRAYTIVSGVPQASLVYYPQGNSFLALLLGFATFVFVFFYLTKRKMKYIEELAIGLLEISKGDLNFRVSEKSEDELGSLAKNINYMAEELNNKIEEERKAEQTKNELITNVSHDLRTPLTSIMGYLRLLKDNKYQEAKQMEDYIDIVYNKSEKLKVLVEDLFEYTRLTNQGVKLSREKVLLNDLLEQLVEELVPVAEDHKIVIAKELSQEKFVVNVDSEKIVRVFENLLMNAIKYSYKPSEIKVKMLKKNEGVIVSIENKGEPISWEELARLFERFYRVDKARTSEKGGSGLGLAIAKNIVELHGGKIWAEAEGENIKFLVELQIA